MPVFGENLQDFNLIKAIEIIAPDFENLILYDLQEKGKTGESLDKIIAILKLDPETYQPIFDSNGQPQIIAVYQSGLPIGPSKIPETTNLVPRFKDIFENLQNQTDLSQII